MKLTSLLLAAMLAVGLTACGKSTPQQLDAQEFAKRCQQNPKDAECVKVYELYQKGGA